MGKRKKSMYVSGGVGVKGIFRIWLGLNEGRPGHATDAS